MSDLNSQFEITCVIVDDEPLAARLLERYCEKTGFVQVRETFFSAENTVAYLRENEVDLVLSDINMPGMNGIELARALSGSELVIFTTAHGEYALEGFQVKAFDYLVKPIAYEDFEASLKRASDYLALLKFAPVEEEGIWLKSGKVKEKVALKDILCISGEREYAKFNLMNGKSIFVLDRLKNILEKLPKQFIQVHRSHIVNFDRIVAVSQNSVFVTGDIEIPVSRQLRPTLFGAINSEE